MKYRILDLLQSVPDGGQLRVQNVKELKRVAFADKLTDVRCQQFCAFKNCFVQDARVTPNDCTECYSHEIMEGELVSDSGRKFQIVGGIPRLLSETTNEFLRKNRKSFSLEWKYSRLGERNWGQDIEFRKSLFLKGFGVDPARLRGKLILDAGCGSGLLAKEMGNSFGMEVVAVDLATGVERAYASNSNPDVHFVQGSVLEPPLKDRVFDFIYCAGVLIHLPNTKEGFSKLPRCLKNGGRYFVWIYHLIGMHSLRSDRLRETIYHWIRTRFTSRLPITMQEYFYLCLVVPYMLKRALINPFAKTKETRTWREKMQNFIDTFSPMHVNRHDEAEVTDWYREHGFGNVAVSYKERYGFGVRGDLLADSEPANKKQISQGSHDGAAIPAGVV